MRGLAWWPNGSLAGKFLPNLSPVRFVVDSVTLISHSLITGGCHREVIELVAPQPGRSIGPGEVGIVVDYRSLRMGARLPAPFSNGGAFYYFW